MKKFKKKIKKSLVGIFDSREGNLENSLRVSLEKLKKIFIKQFSFDIDFEIIVCEENYISLDCGIEDFKFNITVKRIYD